MNHIKTLWKSTYFRVTFWSILIIANILLWYFYNKSSKHRLHEVYSGTQAERIEYWNNLKRINLTETNINSFVDEMMQSCNLQIPKESQAMFMESLTEEQRSDLKDAIVKFIVYYGGNDPKNIYEYISVDRGLGQVRINDQLKLLFSESKKSSNDTDKDLFVYYWNDKNLGFFWQSLLGNSGEFCLWKIKAEQIITNAEILNMTTEDEVLFGNKSITPHLFVEHKPLGKVSMEKELIFSDFYFVTELCKEKNSEFCSVKVRFVLDGNNKWSPFMLITTSTSNSINTNVIF